MAVILYAGGLGSASEPRPLQKWRVVVRALLRSSGVASELAKRWYTGEGSGGLFTAPDEGLSSTRLGYPASAPSVEGGYFCLDVKFTASPPALAASEIVRQWEAALGGEVVYLGAVPDTEGSAAGAAGRSAALESAIDSDGPVPQKVVQAAKDAATGAAKTVTETVDKGLDTLQLLGWAVIIAAVAYALRGKLI